MGKSWRQSRTATLLVGVSLILAAPSMFAAERDSSAMKRILVLGDSLSAGFGLKQSQAYPMLLAGKLHDAGLTNFELTNASQSGGTTSGGLQRLPSHLKRKVDIFIVELGINDAFRGVPVATIRNNLQRIIDMVKERNRVFASSSPGCNCPITQPTVTFSHLDKSTPTSPLRIRRR